MGGSQSSRIISVDEATKLLGPERVQNVTTAFTRVVERSPNAALDEGAFERVVLAALPCIPPLLSHRIFRAFDVDDARQVSVDDFIIAVAILAAGTLEQKARLAFRVYAGRDKASFGGDDAAVVLQAVYGKARGKQGLRQLFGSRYFDTTATLDVFVAFCEDSPTNNYFLAWLEDLAPFLLGEKVPSGLDALPGSTAAGGPDAATVTVFTRAELHHLRDHYSALKRDSPSGRVDAVCLARFVCPPLPRRGAELLARAMGASAASGTVVPVEGFLTSLSVLARGSLEDRLGFLFRVFDADGDGVLSPGEVAEMLALLHTPPADPAAATGQTRAHVLAGGSSPGGALSTLTRAVSSRVVRQTSVSGLAATLATVAAARHPLPPATAQRAADEIVADVGEGGSLGRDAFVRGFASHSPPLLALGATLRRVAAVDLGACPADAAEERDIVAHLYRPFDPRALEPGETWFPVAMGWWQAWQRYTAFSQASTPASASPPSSGATRPGRLDNRPITDSRFPEALRPDITLGHDFVLVCAPVWRALAAWYGAQPHLPRRVVATAPTSPAPVDDVTPPAPKRGRRIGSGSGGAGAATSGALELELYPLRLRVVATSAEGAEDPGTARTLLLSRASSPAAALRVCCEAVRVAPETARVFAVATGDGGSPGAGTPVPVVPAGQASDCRLDDFDLDDGHTMVVVPARPDRTFATPVLRRSAVAAGRSRTPRGRRGRGQRGLVGLANLGNTCYMNSALQCLLHSPPLRDYFARGFARDVNTTNRMGLQGRLAVAYAALSRNVWEDSARWVSPGAIRRAIGSLNPEFAGFAQQDAQELLSYLLSGLADDLNRVPAKPFTELPDSAGRPDAVVAAEWWRSHLRREFSVITRLFNGQFRSVLTCATCGFQSARFEPFCVLPLSLPETSGRTVLLTAVPPTNAFPVLRIAVTVPKTGSLADVRRAIVKLRPWAGVAVSVETLLLASVVDGRVVVWHSDRSPVSALSEHSQALHAFVLDDVPPTDGEGRRALALVTEADEAAAHAARRDLAAGEAVRVLLRGVWVGGVVRGRTDGGRYVVETKDGREVEAHRQAVDVQPPPLAPGTPVFAHWRGDPRRSEFPGTVAAVDADGRYTVQYCDGDRESGLPPRVVRVRDPEVTTVVLVQRRPAPVQGHYFVSALPCRVGRPAAVAVYPGLHSGRQLYRLALKQVRGFLRIGEPPLSAGEADALAGAAADAGDAPPQTPGRKQLAVDTTDDAAAGAETARETDADATRGAAGSGVPQTPLRAGAAAGGDVELSLASPAAGRRAPTPASLSPAEEWGFTLRLVDRDAIAAPGKWGAASFGVAIPPTDDPLPFLEQGACVAVDWDPHVYEEQVNTVEAVAVRVHRSAASAETGTGDGPLTLARCLSAYSSVDKLEGDSETYCGRCKTLRPQTIKMEIWRSPPLLVMQLKRFQFTPTVRRKLHRPVLFPVDKLDLSPFMAREQRPMPPPDLSAWRRLGGRMAGTGAPGTPQCGPVPAGPEADEGLSDSRGLLDGPAAGEGWGGAGARDGLEPGAGGGAGGSKAGRGGSRKRPVPMGSDGRATLPRVASSSSGEAKGTPSGAGGRGRDDSSAREAAEEGEEEGWEPGMTGSELEEDVAGATRTFRSLLRQWVAEARAPPEYELYGVVNHFGALGGGHYVAYVRHDADNKWYCFDDSSCRPISEASVVSPAAYLLFYRRKDTVGQSIDELFPVDPDRPPVDLARINRRRFGVGPLPCSIQ